MDLGVEASGSLSDTEIAEAAFRGKMPSEGPPAATDTDDGLNESGHREPPPSDSEAATGLEVVAWHFSCEENSDTAPELVSRL